MPFKITDEYTSGDMKLILFGETLEELFRDSAIAITTVMTELENLDSGRKIEVSLDSDSHENLLFDWMGEIIYLKDAEQFLPVKVEFAEFNEENYSLKAILLGDTLDSTRHPIKADIKAVTYYEFSLKRIDNKWIGEVLLDL